MGEYLCFADQPLLKPVQPLNEHDRIIMVPIEHLEDLGKKGNAKGTSLIVNKSPFKTGTALVTDIIECSTGENIELIIAFNNGKIWHFEPRS